MYDALQRKQFYTRSRLDFLRCTPSSSSTPDQRAPTWIKNVRQQKKVGGEIKTRRNQVKTRESVELEIRTRTYDIEWQKSRVVKLCNNSKLQAHTHTHTTTWPKRSNDIVRQWWFGIARVYNGNNCIKINYLTWTNGERIYCTCINVASGIKCSFGVGWGMGMGMAHRAIFFAFFCIWSLRMPLKGKSKFNYRNVWVIDAGSFQTFIKYVEDRRSKEKKKCISNMRRMIGLVTESIWKLGYRLIQNQTKSELWWVM